MSYWKNYKAFFVSFMKSWWGEHANAENNWAYDYLPKYDHLYDVLYTMDLMHQGKINGYIAQASTRSPRSRTSRRTSRRSRSSSGWSSWTRSRTETSEFWKNYGEFNDVDPAAIQTEVFRLPTTCFAEEFGSLVSSSRVLQWHWQGADGPGESRSDLEIMGSLFTRMRAMYRKDGGAFPDPIVNMSWPYANPDSRRPRNSRGNTTAARLPTRPIRRIRRRSS